MMMIAPVIPVTSPQPEPLQTGADAESANGLAATAAQPAQAGIGRWTSDVAQAGRYLAQSFRLMVGLPNYDVYVAHMAVTHPGQPAMSYEQFFRERQQARYGGGGGRCC